MRKKKIAMGIVAASLVVAMGIGGTMSYLTDHKDATNTFNVGNVKGKLDEPDWDTTDKNDNGIPDMAEDVVPNQEIPKSVNLTNTGKNDAVVFLKITVPVRNVSFVKDDGTKEEKKMQEIFYLKDIDDLVTTHANNFDPNWVELPDEEEGTDYTGKTRTYVFGYKTRLKSEEVTSLLFDKVQVKNFVENEIATDDLQKIYVDGYFIQADNIVNSNGIIDTTGDMDAATLSEIYEIYLTQNGKDSKGNDDVVTDDTNNTDTNTDNNDSNTDTNTDNNDTNTTDNTDEDKSTVTVVIGTDLNAGYYKISGKEGTNGGTWSLKAPDGSVIVGTELVSTTKSDYVKLVDGMELTLKDSVTCYPASASDAEGNLNSAVQAWLDKQ